MGSLVIWLCVRWSITSPHISTVSPTGSPRLVDCLGQKLQSEPVAFQHIHQRVVKAFAVGQHGGHELRRVITLEPTRIDTPRHHTLANAPCPSDCLAPGLTDPDVMALAACVLRRPRLPAGGPWLQVPDVSVQFPHPLEVQATASSESPRPEAY